MWEEEKGTMDHDNISMHLTPKKFDGTKWRTKRLGLDLWSCISQGKGSWGIWLEKGHSQMKKILVTRHGKRNMPWLCHGFSILWLQMLVPVLSFSTPLMIYGFLYNIFTMTTSIQSRFSSYGAGGVTHVNMGDPWHHWQRNTLPFSLSGMNLISLTHQVRWKLQGVMQYWSNLLKKDQLFHFLMGLDPGLGHLRDQVLAQKPLPNVREAYDFIHSEELRKATNPYNIVTYNAGLFGLGWYNSL